MQSRGQQLSLGFLCDLDSGGIPCSWHNSNGHWATHAQPVHVIATTEFTAHGVLGVKEKLVSAGCNFALAHILNSVLACSSGHACRSYLLTEQQLYDIVVLPNSLQGAAFAHGTASYSSFCSNINTFYEHSCRVLNTPRQILHQLGYTCYNA